MRYNSYYSGSLADASTSRAKKTFRPGGFPISQKTRDLVGLMNDMTILEMVPITGWKYHQLVEVMTRINNGFSQDPMLLAPPNSEFTVITRSGVIYLARLK